MLKTVFLGKLLAPKEVKEALEGTISESNLSIQESLKPQNQETRNHETIHLQHP